MNTRRCWKCGEHIDIGWRLCPRCGAGREPISARQSGPGRPSGRPASGKPPSGNLLTGSAGMDGFLGFLLVLVPAILIGKIFGIHDWLSLSFPGVPLLISIGLYFGVRDRYPTFGRGIYTGLITMVWLIGIGIVCMLLLIAGIIAICGKMK